MPHAFKTTRKESRIVPVWDYDGLILSFGTGEEIARKIRKAGYDAPSPITINGWRHRGRVPSEWVPLFLKWAFKAGTITRIDQLLVKEKVTL
jgi:hypothetical protein